MNHFLFQDHMIVYASLAKIKPDYLLFLQIDGCLHIEKTADKWGKNGIGGEWHEQWSEHYGAGQTDKWAHKWCSIDPNTQLEAGHAHTWHERYIHL